MSGIAAANLGIIVGVQSDVVIVQSDIKVLDPIIDTIKSDLIVVQPKITSILSDTVVLTARTTPPPIISLPAATDADMGASTTVIDCLALAGYGDDYFNSGWYIRIVKNANSVGAAPTGEERQVTDYSSADGVFTCDAFSANVEANDSIVVFYKALAGTKYQAYTTGSGNWTIPIGLDFCDVLIVAGGGSGGGSSTTVAGGGGGGGEIVMRKNYLLRGSTVIAYSVGAGGTAPGTDTTGNPGGNTTFGSLTAYGGQGGSRAGSNAPFGDGGYRPVNSADIINQEIATGGRAGAAWRTSDGTSTTAISSAGQSGKVIGGLDFVRIGGGGGGFRHATNQCPGGQSLSPGGTHTTGDDGNSGGGGGSYGPGANGVSTDVNGVAAAANSGGGGSGGAGLGTARDAGAGGSGYILITWR